MAPNSENVESESPQAKRAEFDIWLVNDDSAQLLVQRRLLGRFVDEVRAFQSPLELLAQRHEVKAGTNLVSDLHMPDMNGIELARTWCTLYPASKVLIVSATALSGVVGEEAADLDPTRTKILTGYRLPELLSVASEWFGFEPSEVAQLDSTDRAHLGLEQFDEETHDKLQALGGRPFLEKALRRFQDRMENRIQILETSLRAEDWTAIKNEAHSLKGSCGVIGATTLLKLADALEISAQSRPSGQLLRVQVEEIKHNWSLTERELSRVLESKPP